MTKLVSLFAHHSFSDLKNSLPYGPFQPLNFKKPKGPIPRILCQGFSQRGSNKAWILQVSQQHPVFLTIGT